MPTVQPRKRPGTSEGGRFDRKTNTDSEVEIGAEERTLTPKQQAAKAKTDALVEKIENGVKELVTGDDWKSYLDFQSKFHNYSFSNAMLIMVQKRDASLVAGYNKWQELGRQVKKGEKSIQILAPSFRKSKDKDGNERVDENGNPVKSLVGFRSVPVFDISQTEGDPLPEIVQRLEGDAPDHMVRNLTEQAKELGAEVQFLDETEEPLFKYGSANGFAAPGEKQGTYRIVVRKGLSPAQTAKTLAHEVGHVAMGHLDPNNAEHGGDITTFEHKLRSDKELEAESFAYMVSNSYGLDSEGYSFGYVAGWSGGDTARVRAAADRVVKTVRPYMFTEMVGDDEQAA